MYVAFESKKNMLELYVRGFTKRRKSVSFFTHFFQVIVLVR